jgi:rhodanese-related sulfurtransferase
MTADALEAAIAAGRAPVIVDVRSPEEFREGHIPGAVNLPFWAAAFRGLELSPSAPAVVYCGHGPRARLARTLLRLRGIRRIDLLDGHMAAWRRSGRPEEAAT